MTESSVIRVIPLKNCEDHFFTHVLDLWGINRKTLGYMPKMGFVEYANRGTILIAIRGDSLLGYAMYGFSRGWARLIHLSVSPSSTRSGVATLLLNELKKVTANLDGILLTCRKNYGLDGLWRNLGFTHRYDRIGKSAAGHLISRWIFEHTPNGVLIAANDYRPVGQSRAVIDTNVFLDIIDDSRPNHESSIALQEDPFSDSIELWVTKELGTDVRNNSHSKSEFSKYNLAHVDQQVYERIIAELEAISPSKNTNSVSDRRQLATAIAFEADYFITRDSDIINVFGTNSNLCDKYNIQIIDPEQAMLMQDELLNANRYIRQPIGHSQWTIKLITASDTQPCADHFAILGQEPLAALQGKIKETANPASGAQVYIMRDDSAAMVAMWLYKQKPGHLRTELIRYRQIKTRYKEAVHRRILMHALDRAASLKTDIIYVTICTKDASHPHELRAIGEQLGFCISDDGNEMTKTVMPFCATGLNDLRISRFIQQTSPAYPPRFIYNTERKFWPLKIQNSNLGGVIIPIHSMWFERLFGGQQLCIDIPMFIALNDDQIYYRSRKNGSAINAPSRIIWYITKGKNGRGAMSYGACSYLDGMETGPAKSIFEKYKRMGAYSWSEIAGLAKGNGKNEIMALRFSMTEIFRTRIPRKPKGDEILKRHGHAKELAANLVAPVGISDAAFHELYQTAMS